MNKMSLEGKKIVLAITGSIAAYKTPQLVRLLIKAGAEVRVLATKAATDFVSVLALSTVSKHAVLTDVSDGSNWNNHVELGLWADAMVVAPCSANTLAKLANGLCDNIISAVYLSARCPVFIAPAMDEDMWLHPATANNLQRVQDYANLIIPVGHGELASGLVGPGRMAEPEEIVYYLIQHFTDDRPLLGETAIVTAGPTYERIDPVRFIGNFSTGKMGIAIAEALANAGAMVTLILGPTQQRCQHKGVQTVYVESAQEMYDAFIGRFEDTDIAVLAAAVADFKPEAIAEEKIKKGTDEGMQLSLVRTPDLLASAGKIKKPEQTLVGFALETAHAEAYGLEKLEKKNADMIVLNSLRDEGAGFGFDTNKITLLMRNGDKVMLPLQSKTEAAKAIVKQIPLLRNAEKTA